MGFSSRVLVVALVVVGLFVFGAGTANADLIINFQEVGGDVVATGSGTVDTTALTFHSSQFNVSYVFPQGASAVVGAPGSISYYSATQFSTFGAGAVTGATSTSGDQFGPDGGFITLPTGYISGTALSGTSTWAGATFASLGMIPGTYVYTWGSGMTADSATVNIGGSAPVPEPGTLALMGLGVLGLAYQRRRRMRAKAS